MSNYSKKLKDLREIRNITQEDLAKKVGLSRAKIASLETGRRELSISDAILICNFYEISLEIFLSPENITRKTVISIVKYFLNSQKISYVEKKNLVKLFAKYEAIPNSRVI